MAGDLKQYKKTEKKSIILYMEVELIEELEKRKDPSITVQECIRRILRDQVAEIKRSS